LRNGTQRRPTENFIAPLSHQARKGKMTSIPLFPGRRGSFKGGVARGDALPVNLPHLVPVAPFHRHDLQVAGHIRVDRYVMAAYHEFTFAQANMILGRIEMESNMEADQVHALKAHLAINVRDVEQSIEFYRKLFGIEPSKVRTGYAKFNVENPPLNFTLNEGPVANRGALSHLGIQVRSTQDVLMTRQKWQAVGLLTRDEMQTSCCYAVQDKTWVRDPDGNEWEVFVVLEDNLEETTPCECGDKVESSSQTTTESAAACCAPNPVEIAR
jgi:catechol 2,3-dioxygenase-like lactoylglutathione lyase family enzyme